MGHCTTLLSVILAAVYVGWPSLLASLRRSRSRSRYPSHNQVIHRGLIVVMQHYRCTTGVMLFSKSFFVFVLEVVEEEEVPVVVICFRRRRAAAAPRQSAVIGQ